MDSSAVVDALGPMSGALRADGYELEVASVSADRLHVTIRPSPEACPDCLAPRAILAEIFAAALENRYRPEQIDIDIDGAVDDVGVSGHL